MTDSTMPGSEETTAPHEYSRRQFARLAGLLGAGASFSRIVPSARASAPAVGQKADTIFLDKNEYWTGPLPQAAQAAQREILSGNRYDPDNLHHDLLQTVASVEHVPFDRVLVWQGSTDPLIRSVPAFCTPERGLVTADPTFEVVWEVAKYLGIPLQRVPLTAADSYATNARTLLAANPKAGLYYLCAPNNPTGTPTSLDEVRWLLDNKPADAVVLVDEAYIHFTNSPSALSLLGERRDLLVLRTFSKLFGMAGLRVGLSFAHPDLHQRMMRYDGEAATGYTNVSALAGAKASLLLPEQIRQRRDSMTAVRNSVEQHLAKRGIKFIPGSQANMIMVDWGRPVAEVTKAFEQGGIAIGRSWAIWPNMSRVTIGSADEMQRFNRQVDRIFRS
ncbi:aminotransferase class I/II-fold pyridoxal phosphate-dependent enzyme [Acetobacter sp.]|uniref:aminotransferase class I/II-fold pyridoxal phosphate-dependent enzyme n=1 Tax=Acetobacter sp. TaxID=440 RepID=UPI0025BD85DD|nr:aminotransferase class I/II-fold pyridoxal phosphate-dependent enzyme [Acetobacter sp.]MCH4091481.1 aminotransferase class I/II-fold pyridoxal phosphate-dependent enzyme [Acetobacter sp.]MCI1299459.1 aminotransferase class I/II-fold pyridoxal phosphate-dependent enzyme [Acetobacter sp.]MCI1316951.1 aminotransferase class I/II-fold pyridoxal phosphate-dependent enzyme [Acetobacter sp.]